MKVGPRPTLACPACETEFDSRFVEDVSLVDALVGLTILECCPGCGGLFRFEKDDYRVPVKKGRGRQKHPARTG
jgi:uncharacterized C2H2 Zn-finger protein